MHVLIVDDHPTNRKLLRAQLEAGGLAVREAADGAAALALLEREPGIDAVVSDIQMPRMDGYRLCHQVRRHPAYAHIPFILYSSTYTAPPDVRLGDTVGADQFIAKPATAEQILSALAIACHQPAARTTAPASDARLLAEYSQVLVGKLEEGNFELQQTVAALAGARDELLALNRTLEQRVQERTAELAESSRQLQQSLSEAGALREFLHVCCYCHEVRDDGDRWETLESHLCRTGAARLSHGICPKCYRERVAPALELLAPKPPS